MIIIELIGSISLAIALVSALALLIIHIKNKQINKTFIHNHTWNNIQQSNRKINHLEEENYQSSSSSSAAAILPFEEINLKKEVSIINVINNKEYSSSLPVKYGIQWIIPSNEEIPIELTNYSSSNNILKTSEFDQGDSLSFSNQTISVQNLIKNFETNYRKEKNNQIDSDLTSIDTNFDNQTIKTERNQNQKKFSYHSSISNFDVTVPSNLSSSIDLEKFECFSTTSNLSEYLNK